MINLPSASADGGIDQDNTPGFFDFSAPIGVGPVGTIQTFTPTVTDISSVDIYLDGGDPGVLIDVSIIDVIGLPVIVEIAFDPGCPCNPLTPIHVDFTGGQLNPLSVGFGNTLNVDHNIASSGASTGWVATFVDTYPDGQAFFVLASGSEDFHFTTFALSLSRW